MECNQQIILGILKAKLGVKLYNNEWKVKQGKKGCIGCGMIDRNLLGVTYRAKEKEQGIQSHVFS